MLVRWRSALDHFRGSPIVAIGLSAAAWSCLAVVFATGDARFTAAFLVLGATASLVAFFGLIVERRWPAYVAFLITLAAPIATVVYVSRQQEGWLG